MGSNFAPMASNVYERCMRIIDSVNVAYITQSMEVLSRTHSYSLD